MHCGLDRAISGATQCLFLSGLMRAQRGRELTCSRPLYSILLSLSPFTPWGVVYRRAIYFLRFANGFPRLGFVFLPIYSLYRIFISRVKIAKGNVKEGTGRTPPGMVKTAILSSFTGYTGSVVAFVGFVMGLWFGCLGGWLMCRIVSRIVVYLLRYLLCFVFCFSFFFSFCFASGCYQPEGVYVCVYRVLIVERLRWLICSTEWFF